MRNLNIENPMKNIREKQKLRFFDNNKIDILLLKLIEFCLKFKKCGGNSFKKITRF